MLKMGHTRSLFIIFQTNKTILQQPIVKNVGSGIQTHDLLNMRLLPLPQDKGSSPTKERCYKT